MSALLFLVVFICSLLSFSGWQDLKAKPSCAQQLKKVSVAAVQIPYRIFILAPYSGVRSIFFAPISDEKLGEIKLFSVPKAQRFKLVKKYIKRVNSPVQTPEEKRAKVALLKAINQKKHEGNNPIDDMSEARLREIYGEDATFDSVLIEDAYLYLDENQAWLRQELIKEPVFVLRSSIKKGLTFTGSILFATGVIAGLYPVLSAMSAGGSAGVSEILHADARRAAFEARALVAGIPKPQLSEALSGLESAELSLTQAAIERRARNHNITINRSLPLFDQEGRYEFTQHGTHVMTLIDSMESARSEEQRELALLMLWHFYFFHPDHVGSEMAELIELEDYLLQILKRHDPNFEFRDRYWNRLVSRLKDPLAVEEPTPDSN